METSYPAEALAGDPLTAPFGEQNPAERLIAAQGYLGSQVAVTGPELVADFGTSIVVADSRRLYQIPTAQPAVYSNIESAAAVHHIMYGKGAAPRMVALVDADPVYRQDALPPRGLCAGVLIPRLRGNGHLPIIISQRIDAGPLDELDHEQLASDFVGFAEAALEHRLVFSGVQAVHDRGAGRATLTNFGAVSRIEPTAGEQLRADYPQFGEQVLEDAAIVAATLDLRPQITPFPVLRAAETLRDTSSLAEAINALVVRRSVWTPRSTKRQ